MATGIVRRQVVQHITESVSEFAKRLPAAVDASRWTMQLATAIQRNPDLMECDPASLLLAAYEAAELGISLSPTLQLGYLVPYKGKAQFQISWRGLVQKAYESGCVRAFYAEVVYDGDKFERQYAPKRNLFHAPAGIDRGDAIGAYALIEFKDGSLDWEYADKKLIERHRKHSKMPDSLMWREFHEEAWKKTAIRILAKRLPMTNPGMEALAEVIERDSQADLEPDPAGRIELEVDSPLIPTEKASQIEPASDGDGNTEIFYQVGDKLTTVTGKTSIIKDDLPKAGAKWDGKARVWTMPATRTHELLELCEARNVSVAEVEGTPAETLFP